MSSKLSHLAAMSVLGTMAAVIANNTHDALDRGDATEPLFSKRTESLRLLIKDFAKTMKIDLRFSKPSDSR